MQHAVSAFSSCSAASYKMEAMPEVASCLSRQCPVARSTVGSKMHQASFNTGLHMEPPSHRFKRTGKQQDWPTLKLYWHDALVAHRHMPSKRQLTAQHLP